MMPENGEGPETTPQRKNQTEQITAYVTPLLGLCVFAEQNRRAGSFPCRDFLRRLNMETTRIQELLDSYGAQKSEKWFPFREATAAGKTFSSVTYNLLHVDKASEQYTLFDIEEDFLGDTGKRLQECKTAIVRSCRELLKQAERCGVRPADIAASYTQCNEELLSSRFPKDRTVRHVDKVGETVVYLATRFLNLSEERRIKELLKQRQMCDFEICVPDVVSEEKCRIVEAGFHNLQSLYDTYIFESDLENQDKNLLYLRGHISIIYHLLQIGTDLLHYYIRHMSQLRRDTYEEMKFPVTPEDLLSIIFDYFFKYANMYMEAAKQLCRSMIRNYSVEAEITVPIPNYRGFHVRPSTLIAKIVAHYGSSVKMYLQGNEYDAGVTLDLFRANEAINAEKRRYITEKISSKQKMKKPVPKNREARKQELQIFFLELMNENEIILYDSNLPFDDLQPEDRENLASLASRCIKHFMSIAKVDVKSSMTITFRGDNRALNDITILAENGYGEDKYGNNIVLPRELSYLRS